MNRCRTFDFDLDLGPDFERFASEAKEAARRFGERLRDMAGEGRSFGFDPFYRPEPRPEEGRSPRYYPYPPVNAYKDREGSLVLQFALAGFDEGSVRIGFQADWLVLTARAPEAGPEDRRYERRGFRPRDVDRQKYYVPAEDYDQAKARAVFRSGLLTVTVPALDIPEAEAVRVNIVREGS
ncbi:MAG TPA: Hsp20 family protein [Spirochaetales bacterium]|nr:Hsp20 family protein [Spirochaetales bacterium]HRY55362.1 Hsp20 family protein [Spirochaetia bacterium]HRZ65656.1 Hsp20 family protein [Spirochaetia bacterium]